MEGHFPGEVQGESRRDPQGTVEDHCRVEDAVLCPWRECSMTVILVGRLDRTDSEQRQVGTPLTVSEGSPSPVLSSNLTGIVRRWRQGADPCLQKPLTDAGVA